MHVGVKLDPTRKEISVLVLAPDPSPEVEELVLRLQSELFPPLRGWQEGEMTLLPQNQIIRCYTQEKRVYARLDDGSSYLLHERLYELEDLLDHKRFVRISSGEIVNLDKVSSIDLSVSGTIRMYLPDGETAYVSRRYIKRIKQILHLDRRGKK